jgi:spermidine synthase
MLNTLGSLSGPFAAGFLLIPLAGKELGLGMVVGLQLITSLVIAGIMLKERKESIARFGLLAVPALAGLVLCFYYPAWNHRQLSTGKYHRFEEISAGIASTGWLESLFQGPKILSRSEKSELVYYGDGIGGFTTVVKYTDAFGNFKYTLANSGKPDASSREDMDTQTLLAHFPMLFHKNPKTVMVIGLASGITAGEVLSYPVENLDILEINDQVVAASNIFIPWNSKVLSAPKTNLIIQDGRAHLQLTRRNYDVIISEPSNPWMAGLAALFTHDFFSLTKDRLNDDGVFVQWMHSYQMDWKTFALVGRTFAGVFPNSLLVHADPSGRGGDYLLVGFKGKERLSLEYAERKIAHVGKSRNVTLKDPRLLYRLIVSEDPGSLFGRGVINTDNRPWLEFSAPRLMYSRDRQISKKVQANRRIGLSTEARNIIQQIKASVDSRTDFAAYALSLFAPFRDMVDLSKATSLQKKRFFKLMESYCSNNELEYSIFKSNELKQHCLSIQIDVIENKIDLLPDRFASLAYLGSLYHLKGKTSRAIKYYQEVLRRDPYSAVTHSNLGIALAKQGRFDEANSHFSEALRIDPHAAVTHNNMAFALTNQGMLDKAISHFSEALRIDPGYTKAHYNMGVALAKQGRLDDAISHFSEALRINPEYTEAHHNMAIALTNQGRLDEAISHFSEALRITPRHMKAHYNMGFALAKQGRFDEAIGHFSEALRINPEYTEAHNDLGFALVKQGRLDEAIGHFSEALRIDPGYAKAHNNLGIALARKGKIEDAVVHFREALRIKPDHVGARNALKEVLKLQGKR